MLWADGAVVRPVPKCLLTGYIKEDKQNLTLVIENLREVLGAGVNFHDNTGINLLNNIGVNLHNNKGINLHNDTGVNLPPPILFLLLLWAFRIVA